MTKPCPCTLVRLSLFPRPLAENPPPDVTLRVG
jgi:hypothetical protein